MSLFALALLAPAGPAGGVIPSAQRVLAAVAEGNQAAGRTGALRLDLELVGREGTVVGTGEILADPSGQARLELRAPSGLVERHLKRGGSYRASRNGTPLADPKPLLPPLALLQLAAALDLETALRRAGVATGELVLGRAGDLDCFVIGGRLPGVDRGDPPLRAAFWVDVESLQPVRIDRPDGIRYALGSGSKFGSLELPAWIQVEVAGRADLRMVIRSAEVVRPAPGSFDSGWLAAPRPAAPSPPPPAAEVRSE